MGQPSPTGKDMQGMTKCGHLQAYMSGAMSDHHLLVNTSVLPVILGRNGFGNDKA